MDENTAISYIIIIYFFPSILNKVKCVKYDKNRLQIDDSFDV